VIPSERNAHGARRPSNRELYNKLVEASSLIRSGRWIPQDLRKLNANFVEIEETFKIDATSVEDQKNLLLSALGEVRVEHYAGSHPPTKSYEPAAQHQEMFPFKWQSEFFVKTEMYLKFCLIGDDKNRAVCVFSLHPHRSI
jgi:hypothetical protein